jgi:heptosyltransferase-3
MKVLLIRTDRMGDVILSTPVATLIKRAHPDWRVEMLVARQLVPLVGVHRDVDAVLEFGGRDSSLRELVRLLRSRRYDAAVLLHPTFRLALSLWLARIPRRIGTAYRLYSFLLNERVPVHRKRSRLHELELNVLTASPLGLAPLPESGELFRFELPEEEERRLAEKLARAGVEPAARPIVLHPGSGGSARNWPVRRFAELAELLHARGIGPIVITGTSAERQLVDELVRLAAVPLVRLDGELEILQLAALLQRARVVVANSTGPLHLAVAMGAPVVGLYCPIGPCHPRRWGPYGRRDAVLMPDVPECDRCRASCPHYDCMESIPADRVAAKIGQVMQLSEGDRARRQPLGAEAENAVSYGDQ